MPNNPVTDVTEAYVNDVSLILDNDQDLHLATRAAVFSNLRTGSGYPNLDPDTYQDLYRNRPHELAEVAALGVQEVLEELFEKQAQGPARLMLQQLVIDGSILRALGEGYLPDPEDYRDDYEELDDE